ncbi:hypothetical protein BD413DRAFT_539696 [Trametes elegans]|nr:hypothetical protein BD413DRAFT_539696 [Trametes elegans]
MMRLYEEGHEGSGWEGRLETILLQILTSFDGAPVEPLSVEGAFVEVGVEAWDAPFEHFRGLKKVELLARSQCNANHPDALDFFSLQALCSLCTLPQDQREAAAGRSDADTNVPRCPILEQVELRGWKWETEVEALIAFLEARAYCAPSIF